MAGVVLSGREAAVSSQGARPGRPRAARAELLWLVCGGGVLRSWVLGLQVPGWG